MTTLHLRLLTFSFLVLFRLTALSQYSGYDGWKADWINVSGFPASENTWTCFVKEVDLADSLTGPLIARIAADSKYWLWINGQLVVFEGELKRGPTPNDTYYDEVNIAPFLKKGHNTIAAMVWFWDRDGFCYKSSGQMGFLFDAQSPGINVLSGDDWKAHIDSAYGNTSDPIPNFRLPEYNVKFYALKDMPDWKKAGGSEKWSNVDVIGPAGCAPWNKLWKRPFPGWKNSGLVAYKNPVQFPFVSDGSVIKMTLPKNYTITPYLKIEGTENQLIDIRTDNYHGGSEYNVRAEYVTKNGEQEYESFGYMNGHEVQYAIPKGIKVIDLRYRRTSFPTEHIGSFVSNDSSMNKLWDKSLNTMDVNMRDAIQDADRERSQWWGDAVTILGEIFYTCDSNGTKAVRKAMSNLVEWQRPDSVLYSPVPSGEWKYELPTQMLAAIGKYGFWRYFEFTGDSTMMHYVYPYVKKYLAKWKIGNDGLIVHREGEWDWFDWGENIDQDVLENAWYCIAVESAYRMALLNKDATTAEMYQKQLNTIRDNVNKLYWTGKAYRSPNYKGETDDRAQGLAVVAGIADSSKYAAIQAVLKEEFHAGPYLEKYIIEALFLMKQPEMAESRMLNRYQKMISSPLTTLWEGWDIGSAVYGGGSYNHGWSGGPLTLMHEYIAGVAPLLPGFKQVSIAPQMGSLSRVHCVTPTPRGDVIVDIKKDSKGSRLVAEIPASTSGLIILPIEKNRNFLTINNKRFSFSQPKKAGDIKFLGIKNGSCQLTVPSGKWTVSW